VISAAWAFPFILFVKAGFYLSIHNIRFCCQSFLFATGAPAKQKFVWVWVCGCGCGCGCKFGCTCETEIQCNWHACIQAVRNINANYFTLKSTMPVCECLAFVFVLLIGIICMQGDFPMQNDFPNGICMQNDFSNGICMQNDFPNLSTCYCSLQRQFQ
jgi:hypothetical protein